MSSVVKVVRRTEAVMPLRFAYAICYMYATCMLCASYVLGLNYPSSVPSPSPLRPLSVPYRALPLIMALEPLDAPPPLILDINSFLIH